MYGITVSEKQYIQLARQYLINTEARIPGTDEVLGIVTAIESATVIENTAMLQVEVEVSRPEMIAKFSLANDMYDSMMKTLSIVEWLLYAVNPSSQIQAKNIFSNKLSGMLSKKEFSNLSILWAEYIEEGDQAAFIRGIEFPVPLFAMLQEIKPDIPESGVKTIVDSLTPLG